MADVGGPGEIMLGEDNYQNVLPYGAAFKAARYACLAVVIILRSSSSLARRHHWRPLHVAGGGLQRGASISRRRHGGALPADNENAPCRHFCSAGEPISNSLFVRSEITRW